MLIRWGSYNALLTEFVVGVTAADTYPTTKVHVLVEHAAQESNAYAILDGAGAVMSNVEFITYDSDSVWIRDYGPQFTYEDDNRTIIDHTYNRPTRPNDNAFSEFLATLWGEPIYDLGLIRGGGNFQVLSNGEGFSSDLALDPDEDGIDEYTEAEIKQAYVDYMNVDVTLYERLPDSIDATGHIDMWLIPLSETDFIVSEFAGGTGKTITDAGAADLVSRGYNVYRTPAWSTGTAHYTYANAAIVNNKVFIPWYSGYDTENAIALSTYQTAMPGHTIVQVDTSSIISDAGAIHCVMKHVHVATPGTCKGFNDAFDDDGDGLPDGCDDCIGAAPGQAEMIDPKLKLDKIGNDAIVGNDKLRIKGTVMLPDGTEFSDLDLATDGARVVVSISNGDDPVDVFIAGEVYDGTSGWRMNEARTAWIFRDRLSLAEHNGIARLKVKSRHDGVRVRVKGKNGNYQVTAADLPPRLTLVLGDAAAGECAETEFPLEACRFNGRGIGLNCR